MTTKGERPTIAGLFARKNQLLKTFPDIGAKCIQTKSDLPYRLWLLFRQKHPVGWLTTQDAFTESLWNRRQTKRWLDQGEGTFWTFYENRIYLKGIVKVCKTLNVRLFNPPVFLPLDKVKNLCTFRAFSFASWFAQKPRTISQKKLSEIFGRSVRTLYTWSRLSSLEITHNVAWSSLPTDSTIEKYPVGALRILGLKEAEEESGKVHNVWLETWEDGKVLCFTLPNTYRVNLKTGTFSRLQRKARQAVDYAATAPAHVFVEKGINQGKKALRLLRKNGAVYVEENRKHHEYQLWNYVVKPQKTSDILCG